MPAPTSLLAKSDTRQLWRFIGFYGVSEFAQRASRIVTTILLARLLVPEAFGVAAIAITTFELFRVISNCGIGQAVIRASDEELPAAAETAWRLLWPLMIGLAAAQTGAGYILSLITGRGELFWMLAALSAVYLMMPFGLIQTYLVQRQNRHGVIATVSTVQALTDNVLTGILALFGFGAWAIVLPKVLTTPFWVIGMRQSQSWTRDPSITPLPRRTMLAFALPIIGSELVATARLQLDKVIVGAVLGIEALGIYYFVFNAGLGLSLSISGALVASVYPYLAEAGRNMDELRRRFSLSLKRTALPIAGLIVLQAVAALVYVPILFGRRWSEQAVLVAVLCLSGIARPLADVSGQMLRAAGLQQIDFKASIATTIVCLLVFAVALPFGLLPGIAVLAVATVGAQIGYAIIAHRIIATHETTVPAGVVA